MFISQPFDVRAVSVNPSAYEEGPVFRLLSAGQLLRLVAPGIEAGRSSSGPISCGPYFYFQHRDTGLKLLDIQGCWHDGRLRVGIHISGSGQDNLVVDQ